MREKYSIHNPTEVGFVHVRRGDYVNHPCFYWSESHTYYATAFHHAKPSRWLLLSDDVAWCREQPFLSDCEIIEEPDELCGLALMSLCHGGAILANSTYSWWGAMLGSEQSGAPVVYPSKWCDQFKPDLFPERWISI